MLPEAFTRRALMAHRGLAASFPENTMPAIVAASEAGIGLIEFDLQLTADGVPVLMHDASLARTCDVDIDVRTVEVADLHAYRAAHTTHFGAQFADASIPTLAQCIDFFAGRPDLNPLIEVKSESVASAGLEAFMDAVLEVIEPVRSTGIVISFHRGALEYARAANWPIGLCIKNHDDVDRQNAESLRPEVLMVNEVNLREPGDVWPGPWHLGCWEVTTPERAVALWEMGVKMIESKRADQLACSLEVQHYLNAR
jgi:glycerophosphoryl diester phosphodiesterase